MHKPRRDQHVRTKRRMRNAARRHERFKKKHLKRTSNNETSLGLSHHKTEPGRQRAKRIGSYI